MNLYDLQCPDILRLGGSLLNLHDLIERLSAFIQHHQLRRVLIVVGGGAPVDMIRGFHKRHWLSDHQAHWQAIQMMSDNARWLARLDNRLAYAAVAPVPSKTDSGCKITLLDTLTFLTSWGVDNSSRQRQPAPTEHEQSFSVLPALPESWDVSSDSIAVWVARAMNARNVWLLKSCNGPEGPLEVSEIEKVCSRGPIDNYVK